MKVKEKSEKVGLKLNIQKTKIMASCPISSVQFSCSVVSDSATPWTTARQASLSITNSRSLPKLMSIESVMPSNDLILCCPLLLLPSVFLSIRVFSNESFQLFASGGQSIGVSASTSVLPMNTQDWSPLGWFIISWQIDGKTVERETDFILGGSKITADGDCSYEIKRCLLIGRKVITNLDSVLKSRDITLPTKVCLVKAMVFPVVMYGCESWTIKKVEHWRIDAFELWC